MGIYLGLIDADPSVVFKNNTKHDITMADVKEALQWPARAEVRADDDPEHGWRVLAFGATGLGREVFAVLIPMPEYEYERAETWLCKSARWL